VVRTTPRIGIVVKQYVASGRSVEVIASVLGTVGMQKPTSTLHDAQLSLVHLPALHLKTIIPQSDFEYYFRCQSHLTIGCSLLSYQR
jgi:hypothetical protein